MRRGRLSGAGDSNEDLHINLTPLIDVVFVVLIMFIVIAPMLELDRVRLAQGGKHVDEKISVVNKEGLIAVYVHADDSIWVSGHRLLERDLLSFFKKIRKEKPGEIPQIFHDTRAHFGTYQMIKNAVEEAGFEQMDIILQPG